MKFYVIWSVTYDIPSTVATFNSEEEVASFLAEQSKAYTKDFHFIVLEGREITFVPVMVALSFQRAR